MKKQYKYLLLSLLFIPTVVLASTYDTSDYISAIFMEAFCTIHMTFFCLMPLANLISKDNSRPLFWRLFIIRIVFLLLMDIFVSPYISYVDFFAVFIGAFTFTPLCMSKKIKPIGLTPVKEGSPFNGNMSTPNSIATTTTNTNSFCSQCGAVIPAGQSVCPLCKTPIGGNVPPISANEQLQQVKYVTKADFDPVFQPFSEEIVLQAFLKREMNKAEIDEKSKMMPHDAIRRKNIIGIIMAILLFVYVALFFFHFPAYTYIIGFIILMIFKGLSKNYNITQYLIKEIKSRPQEKISNIVMEAKNNYVVDDKKILRLGICIVAMVLPLLIFWQPRIFYEKVNNGYAVRFYCYGITNFKTATIPSEHNGKPVVSLRGNAFSNMPLLTTVSLPDTITEIRGQAFKNDSSLKTVNIPTSLEYLGGGAFYGCSSLEEVTLPDTLTFLGGESFYEASSLKKVKLSNQLLEIRGDSFEYCTSLEEIEIPDSVARIGGHAFYGDTALSKVTFTENSDLSEIGSSAFRDCYNLETITIPKGTFVNERAFKDSPTKICYFGEECLTTDNYEKNYTYNQFVEVKMSEPFEDTRTDLKIELAQAGTINTEDGTEYSYHLNVTQNGETKEITLQTTSTEKTYTSSDLTIIVSSGDTDHVYLYVYYN